MSAITDPTSTLSTSHRSQPTTSAPLPSQSQSQPQSQNYKYYHAGPLFTLSDLHTNTLFSTLIHTISQSPPKSNPQNSVPFPSFTPLLPQDLEPRLLSPRTIRDTDLLSLLRCDCALFTYDGAELDAGTVVEYMVAKFADIPAVVLRTDIRSSGDQQGSVDGGGGGGSGGKGGADAWNLMSSFWPRTKVVRIDSMSLYKSALAQVMAKQKHHLGTTTAPTTIGLKDGGNVLASTALLEKVAEEVVAAMREVVDMRRVMPGGRVREGVYEWLSICPGLGEEERIEVGRVMQERLERERARDLEEDGGR